MLVKRVNNIFRAGEKMDGKRKKKRGREREKNGLYRRITGGEGEKASFIVELVKKERRNFRMEIFSAL